jgi:DNA-binding beta-propeller fold protein YncE
MLQALALANDGNLWVSGAGGMSLLRIDPLAPGVGGEFTPDSTGSSTVLTPGNAAINLIAAQGGTGEAVCNLDNCCEEGGYNTGTAVSRATGDVYVTNECPTGKVLHFTAAGSLVSGGTIDIGSFPSGINVSLSAALSDAAGHPWVLYCRLGTVMMGMSQSPNFKPLLPGATDAWSPPQSCCYACRPMPSTTSGCRS